MGRGGQASQLSVERGRDGLRAQVLRGGSPWPGLAEGALAEEPICPKALLPQIRKPRLREGRGHADGHLGEGVCDQSHAP